MVGGSRLTSQCFFPSLRRLQAQQLDKIFMVTLDELRKGRNQRLWFKTNLKVC